MPRKRIIALPPHSVGMGLSPVSGRGYSVHFASRIGDGPTAVVGREVLTSLSIEEATKLQVQLEIYIARAKQAESQSTG